MFLWFAFLTGVCSLFNWLFQTYFVGFDSFVVHGSELSWASGSNAVGLYVVNVI